MRKRRRRTEDHLFSTNKGMNNNNSRASIQNTLVYKDDMLRSERPSGLVYRLCALGGNDHSSSSSSSASASVPLSDALVSNP
jgi:hypothetical protein